MLIETCGIYKSSETGTDPLESSTLRCTRATSSLDFFTFVTPFLYSATHELKMVGMNKKKALMTFTLVLLAAVPALTLVAPVVEGSSERIVGVKVGDWIKYGNFYASWTSDDPNAQEPPKDLIEHSSIEWITNTVQNIVGTNITFQTVTHYKNGTETTSMYHVDIKTGEGNATFAFISANLDAGESVYTSIEYADTWINETAPLVYVNALRETNYLLASMYEVVPGDVEQTLFYQTEAFWDKATGILSERAGTVVQTYEVYGVEFTSVAIRSEVMIDTSLWEENPDTTPPTAQAGPDQTAVVNEIVRFDAQNSSDNKDGWGIASYEWDFADGTQGTGMTIKHAFDAPGNYTVTLKVEDWAGNSHTDTLIVTVEETSSELPIMTLVILAILLIAMLFFFWGLKAKRG